MDAVETDTAAEHDDIIPRLRAFLVKFSAIVFARDKSDRAAEYQRLAALT